ncbi:MAG: acyl-CoA carboxylase subunit epsilon [Actinomycetes bacterium]
MSSDDTRPVLRIVRGDATAEEIAALVTVLAATSGGQSGETPAAASAWSDRAALTRGVLPHGPHAWRSSAWTR